MDSSFFQGGVCLGRMGRELLTWFTLSFSLLFYTAFLGMMYSKEFFEHLVCNIIHYRNYNTILNLHLLWHLDSLLLFFPLQTDSIYLQVCILFYNSQLSNLNDLLVYNMTNRFI